MSGSSLKTTFTANTYTFTATANISHEVCMVEMLINAGFFVCVIVSSVSA